MEFHKLNVTEHNQTRSLWEQVFTDDSTRFLDYYYQEKTRNNEIFVATQTGDIQMMSTDENAGKGFDDNNICSMLQLNPYKMHLGNSLFTGNYIIAVATDPAYRKRGFMGRLLHLSLNEMHQRGEVFTFLMPAAEAIYLPYDFRFVYAQSQGCLTGIKPPVTSELRICRAEAADCQQMALLAESCLAARYQIYAVRDEDYYLRMLKEQESENGGFIVIYDQEELVGFFAYAYEKEFEIREPILRPGFEQAFSYGIYQLTQNEEQRVKCCAFEGVNERKQVPLIMFRILHPDVVMGEVIATEDFKISLRIRDDIIAENNRCFDLCGRKGVQITVTQSREPADQTITIAALASFLFGFKTAAEIAGEEQVTLSKSTITELQKLKPLSQIFINEIV